MARITAEVISIGDEMTSGARLDTNAQWLSRRIGELGIEVTFHSTVGDCLQDNIDVFRIAAGRVDVVVCTGGLGPTRDDLTRQAIADAAGVRLFEHAESLQHIRQLFSKRGRTMPERNCIQAMIPVGGKAIFNPRGTAPGVDMFVPATGSGSTGEASAGARVFALPGVPAEMKRMFADSVTPALVELSGQGQVIRHHVMRFFGTGESDMEERLGDMIARDRQPRVGITVTAATISLRIAAMADTEIRAEELIEKGRTEIMDRVAEFYFGDGDGYEQHHASEGILQQRGEKLIVIELGRAAPIADWFASVESPGKPAYVGGLSFGDTASMLRVTSQSNHAEAVAKLMTDYQADWAILVDEYPQLPSDSKISDPDDVAMHIYRGGKLVGSQTKSFGGHPSILHPRIGKTALQLLRQCLAESAG